MPNSLEFVRRATGAPSRAIDRLFGYDVFIAHRRADAAAYAGLLVQRLDQEKLSTFVDVREYGPGDELAASTLRHIRKATMLVVLGSPAISEVRTPDWVLSEIETYWTANVEKSLRVLPVDFGGTLATADDRCSIAVRLRNVIRLDQPLEALHQPPSAAVIEAIVRQFRNRRRDTVRLRVFQGIAGVMFALLLGALGAAWLANRALSDAQRNLAANYMTAAKSRLDLGFRDEATALAAESLRHVDQPEARRLITENPPLDLSHVLAAEEVSTFGTDVDLPRKRWAAVGFKGQLALLDLEGGARRDVKLGKVDLFAVRFTPDGAHLLIGDDRGQMYVRAVSDLDPSACDALPKFPDRISQFEFLPERNGVLVSADNALYIVELDRGCPSSAPRQIYRSAEGIIEFVIDASRQRIIVAETSGLASVVLSDAAPPAMHFTLPIPPGRSERPQPARIALHMQSGKLCVLTLGGDELVFLDDQFIPTTPFGLRPFGAAKAPLGVGIFAFDARGERLVISHDNAQLLVWSMTQGRVQRRLRLHDSGGVGALQGDAIVSLGQERSGTGPSQQVLRVVAFDPPSNTPVSLAGSNVKTGPPVSSLETSPRGTRVLAATVDGRVLSFDFESRDVVDVARTDVSVSWAARANDGERFAFFGDGAQVELRDARGVLRRASFIEQSPTGLYSAAWLNDGSALVVGGGWTEPYLLPVDPGGPMLTGPIKVKRDIENLVAGPNRRVLVHADSTWIWDTTQNHMQPVNLVGASAAALTDVERWGGDGVAALTRQNLFLWRWRAAGQLEQVAAVAISGDRMVVSADGRRAALFQRNRLLVHDLPSGELRALLPLPGDVYAGAFREDASMLLAGARSAPFELWSLHALDAPPATVADMIHRLTGRVNADFTLALPLPSATDLPRATSAPR